MSHQDNYYNIKAVSNSAIGMWLKSPMKFFQFWELGFGIEESVPMKIGSALHCLVLEPHKFKDEYAINKKTIQYSEIEAMLKETANYCQEHKITDYATREKILLDFRRKRKFQPTWKDETIINKSLIEHIDFYEFYLENKNKAIISQSQYDMICQMRDNIEKHKRANWFLRLITDDDYDVFTEVDILFEMNIRDGFPSLPCKAKLDKLVIDKKNKIIYLIDVKTTSKSVNEFYKSVRDYDYGRQMYFYTLALWHLLANKYNWLYDEDVKLEYKFIVSETNPVYECKVYNVKQELINSEYRINKVNEILRDINYAINNNEFSYTRTYLEGNGEEELYI